MTDSEQKAPPKREVVVVLGSGRSGTSLAMQAIRALGISISDDVISPNASNPKGFFEDSRILEVHKGLLRELTEHPTLPLKNAWVNSKAANESLNVLKKIVSQELENGGGVWAFKDPRTATFLPLWTRLFNQLSVTPKYVLTIRHPSAIISSYIAQYGMEPRAAELIYLHRLVDSVYYTGGDLLLFEYEHWFKDAEKQFSLIAEFLGRDPIRNEKYSLDVEPQLNRSGASNHRILNPVISELYALMLKSRGGSYGLSDEVQSYVSRYLEIRKSFEPWVDFLNRNSDKLAESSAEINRQRKKINNLKLVAEKCDGTKKANKELGTITSDFERYLDY